MSDTIENDEIYTLRLCSGNIRTVSKKFLKECSYLENAKIFQRLFNLIEHTPFKTYEMRKNNHNELILLQDYGIKANDWDLVMHYITYGFTFAYYDDAEYKKIKYLDRTCHIINILGGIPSFDEFYLNFQKNKEKKQNIYNPMCPRDDYQMKYDWIVTTCYNLKDYPDFENWEVTQHAYHDDAAGGGRDFYYRKLKDNFNK